MIRLIRVILSADTQKFTGQIDKAARAFRGFVGHIASGVKSAYSELVSLGRGLFFIREGIQTLINIARGFFDTFLSGAINVERMGIALEVITDDANQAGEMIEFLRGESARLGLDFAGTAQTGQQLAVALRGAQGAVDQDTWEDLVRQVEAFQALRPDVPVQLWGRAISGFLAGDPTTLTRLLDVNVRQLGNLTEEAKAFLDTAGEAGEKQLGQVTRLGEGVTGDMDNALDALEAVAEAVGATDELTERLADTTGGKLARAQETMNEKMRELGERLLPHVNELLDNLLELMDSDEFNQFIDSFGDIAIQGIGALASVDWQAFADTLSRAVELANRISKKPGEAGQTLEMAAEATRLAGGEDTKAAAGLRTAESFDNPISRAIGGLFGGRQQVDVTIGFDDEGAPVVRRIAKEESAAAAMNLVRGVTQE